MSANQTAPRPPVIARLLFSLYHGAISPLMHTLSPSRCRYLPTCSEYAYVAVARFGLVRGSWLALRRLSRCHPFSAGGLDPVPLPASIQQSAAQSPDR